MIGSRFVLLPMRVIGVLIGYFTLHSEMEMAGTVPVVRLPYRPLGFVPSIFIAKMERHLSLNARWFLKCITSFCDCENLFIFNPGLLDRCSYIICPWNRIFEKVKSCSSYFSMLQYASVCAKGEKNNEHIQ